MGFQEFMDEKIAPGMNKFAQLRHIQAIRDGVVINLVPSMIGSVFLLLAALPIDAYKEFIVANGIFNAMLIPIDATMGIMGLTACISIAYRLAESYKVDALPAGIISLLCFLVLTPFSTNYNIMNGDAIVETVLIGGVVPLKYLGSGGLFSAIFVSLIATEIYVKLMKKNIVITMPDGVPPSVAGSFAALIPGTITMVAFWLIRLVFDASPFENVHTFLSESVMGPLTGVFGGSIFGAIAFMFLVHFFWFFGIHGHLVIGPILDPIFTVLQDQNRMAFQAGEEIPNIITRYWFDLYVTLGGSGATLSVIIAMLLFARSKHLKEVGKLSLAPGIFNINEPFIFGIPVVFNPVVFIPWIFVPIMNICTAYFATIIGFLPRHNGIIAPWTMPIVFSGFMVAGWRGALMQLINLGLSAIVWFAFMKRIDNMEADRELEELK